jgi:hypothetical protein
MRVRLQFLIPGVILLLLGLTWLLQGAGVMKGSFMTGQKLWLVVGILVALIGLVVGWLGLAAGPRRA